MAPPVIPPQHAMRFRSGRLCLDFVHTGEDEHMRELIHSAADLAFFLGALLGIDRVRASRDGVVAARELRDAVRDGTISVMVGARPSIAAVDTINAFAAHPPVVSRLSADGRTLMASATCGQALSTIARDAIDLLSSDVGTRIRTCAADDCGLFLLDTSRPNKRRWCSMELCGNRSKIRSYRTRAHEG